MKLKIKPLHIYIFCLLVLQLKTKPLDSVVPYARIKYNFCFGSFMPNIYITQISIILLH